jgi:hypothetical protein
MKAGEEWKLLAQLTEADPSSAGFLVLDPSSSSEARRIGPADNYSAASELRLHGGVPPGIRGYFDAALMLWVYGWFYYPFYTWAGFHAGAAAEAALRARFNAPSKKRTFASMIDQAVARKWITPERFRRIVLQKEEAARLSEISSDIGEAAARYDWNEHLRPQLAAFRSVRNWHAHPESLNYVTPHMGYDLLEFSSDIISQLFPRPDPDAV